MCQLVSTNQDGFKCPLVSNFRNKNEMWDKLFLLESKSSPLCRYNLESTYPQLVVRLRFCCRTFLARKATLNHPNIVLNNDTKLPPDKYKSSTKSIDYKCESIFAYWSIDLARLTDLSKIIFRTINDKVLNGTICTIIFCWQSVSWSLDHRSR